MSDDFADAHDELRTLARSVLDKTAVATSGDAEVPAAPDWQTIAAAGWLGLEVPEAFGGAGATFAEVAVLLQEMGRATAGGPYASVAALSVSLLDMLGPGRSRDALLRETVSGSAVPIVAVDAQTLARPASEPVPAPFRIERTGAGAVLHGRCDLVLDAPYADRFLLLARRDDMAYVAVVEADHSGLSITEDPVVDPTRRIGSVVAESVEVAAESLWPLCDPSRVWQRLCDRAAVAFACDSLGIGEAALSRTVDYAAVREQFGRPVGSFQAVKHGCADMATQLAVARQLVDPAVRRQVEKVQVEKVMEAPAEKASEAPAANSSEASAGKSAESTVTASMAKSYASTAAVDIAGKAMQLHGGVGYTWESGVHVYLKRALFNRAAFGSPAEHRERLAQRFSTQVASALI